MLLNQLVALATPAARYLQDKPGKTALTQFLHHASQTQDSSPLTTEFAEPGPHYNTRIKRTTDGELAVLISNGITLEPSRRLVNAFAETICGYWQDYDNPNFLQAGIACGGQYSCGTQGSLVGCIPTGSGSTLTNTGCSNIGSSAYYEITTFATNVLSCGEAPGYGRWSICQTQHLSGATAFSCISETRTITNVWLLAPADVWQGFAGYTLTNTPPISTSDGWIPLDPSTTLPFVVPSGAANEMLSALNLELDGCMASLVPKCNISSDAIQSLSVGHLDRDSFCDMVINATCPGLCVTGTEPIDRIDWTINNCADGPVNEVSYISLWTDYAMLADLAFDSMFPWRWRLYYNESQIEEQHRPDDPPKCPSVGSQLLAFGVTNMVVLALTLVVGHRGVVKKVTCSWLGSNTTKWWPLSIVIGVALNVTANYINALITHNSPGFDQFEVRQLLLLWCSRPRASWLILLGAIWDDANVYTSTAVAALGTEVVLQALGSYYLGRTVDYGRKNGFYKLGRLDRVRRYQDALIMYAGAMLWATTVIFAFFYALISLTPVGSVLWKLGKMAWTKIRRSSNTEYKQAPRVAPSDDESGYLYANPSAQLQINPLNHHPKRPGSNDEIIRLRENLTSRGYLSRRLNESRRPLTSKLQVPSNSEDDTPNFRTEFVYNRLRRSFKIIMLFMITPWAGQWLFWVGFLRMADNAYCPPQLWTNVGVWSIFSIVSNFFGAGM